MKLFTASVALFATLSFSCTEKEIKPENTTATKVVIAEDSKRNEILDFAKNYLGTPYKYGTSSPKGFDCSGFVNYVFKNFNIEVPRSSSGFANFGETVKPEDFKVGDVLVFYGYRDRKSVGHVGIISEANGMQSKFIHASSGREMAVIISDLGSKQYSGRFYKCVRVL